MVNGANCGGSTLYPDTISSNGQVVVLGTEVLSSQPQQISLASIPLTTDDYTIDQPDIQNLTAGDNIPFSKLVLRLPGVS